MEMHMLSGMWERFNHTAHPFYVNRFIQTKKSGNELTNHFHDFAQIFYLVSGRYTHTVGDFTFEGEAGSMIIVPPGYRHRYTIDDDTSSCELIMICIMPSFFDKPTSKRQLPAFTNLFFHTFSEELLFDAVFFRKFDGAEKEKTESFFMKLASYNWLRNVNNFNSLRNMFCDIFSSEDFSLSEKASKKCAAFLENKYIPLIKTIYYMNANYNKAVHRDELISISNLCQTEYFKLIKKTFGCTFSNYIQMLRVRRAIHMCSFTTYSLSYIADICGFGDLAYMEKRIKKFHPKSKLPREMKKNRSDYIKAYPFSIKSRSEYENISKLFYVYDTQRQVP